ncbi:hypothetical protein JKA74_17420 [Marivirga sp. S37H4]|uniref:Uncharacterized protein n=1 Tax=Marivirga aurantiaca TaxID=2802615 RepID=A0A934X1P2_9BACT|nr:hypothetical protein [Marivirga aurantiaca]MBK6266827.1 hypothetical protein [Marivirga aurantiaca]
MKKPILLSFSVLVALFILNQPKASAQNFHIVASFGTTHAWNVPAAIEYEIYDYYPYHNWVHVNRVVRGRRVFYNILLERDGFFTELQFGRYSRILRIQHYVDYPLYDHYCSAHCGYHERYYVNQRVSNNYYYYGGHNHYVYSPQPKYMREPVRPQSVRYADNHYNRSNRAVADNSRIVSSARNSRPESIRNADNDRSDRTRTANANPRSNSQIRSSGTTRSSGSTRSVGNSSSENGRTISSTRSSGNTRSVSNTPANSNTRSTPATRTVSNSNDRRSAGTVKSTSRTSNSSHKSVTRSADSSRSGKSSGAVSRSNSSRSSGRGN